MTTPIEERDALHSVQARWDRHEASIEQSLRELRRLAFEPTQLSAHDRDGVIDIVRGSQGVWQAWWMYADLHDTTEICAIVPDLQPLLESMSDASADHYADVVSLLRSRSFRFRLILPARSRENAVAARVVDELVALGVQVRLAETSHWFFVSRARTAVLPAGWGPPDATDVLVMRSGPVAAALTDLFDLRWSAAAPWRVEADARDAVLALLAEGHDDKAVADILGVSLRTVHRRVAEAMAEHRVTTRFALGLAYAGSRGPG